MPETITKLLIFPTFLLVVGVILCAEAVFMAESFTGLLELAHQSGGSTFDAMKLVMLKAPEILDFAIPIALLVGVYFSVSTLRDERAFIVCAAAGVSWIRLVVFAGVLGGLSALISFGVSGFVIPQTLHLQRMALFEMTAQQTTSQLLHHVQTKTIQHVPGMTFISIHDPLTKDMQSDGLFVHFDTDAPTWHVSLADDWVVTGPGEDGTYQVHLRNFRDYTGSVHPNNLALIEGEDKMAGAETPQFSSLLVKETAIEFNLQTLLGEKDEDRQIDELFLGRLAKTLATTDSGTALKTLADKIARALLCPFATLTALLATALSTRRWGRQTALPLAAVALLSLDVASQTFLRWAATGGAVTLANGSLALLVVILLPVLGLIGFFGERVVLPRMGDNA